MNGSDLPDNVTPITQDDAGSHDNFALIRMIEALLFASDEPLSAVAITAHLNAHADAGQADGHAGGRADGGGDGIGLEMIEALLRELQKSCSHRGVHLVQVAGKWQFRTAPDLAGLLAIRQPQARKLSKAALETLAIIAWHQPVTRAEIEAIRGVSTSKGTLDILLESSWIELRGRKRVPGRPLMYGTGAAFLVHFGLQDITDLPGRAELEAAGLMAPDDAPAQIAAEGAAADGVNEAGRPTDDKP